MDTSLVRFSKFMSRVLRHSPERIGLTVDAHGWAEVEELIAQAQAQRNGPLTREIVALVVAESDKQRFALSPDGQKIRANDGHTLKVRIEREAQTPPEILYHGTATRFLRAIQQQGLRPKVHLSQDVATAERAGKRHGQLVMLTARAAAMHTAGHLFYLAGRGLWLTTQSPVEFLIFPENIGD
jgi:putative RNA 2'-phosphotransferase